MADSRGPRSSSTLLERIVLDAFDGYAALTRPQLVDATGLSRPTVTAIVAALVARGELTESEASPAPGVRGRPSLTYRRTAMAAPIVLIRLAHGMTTRLSLLAEHGQSTEIDTGVSWREPWDPWASAVREAFALVESAAELPVRHVVLAAPFPVREGHRAPDFGPYPPRPGAGSAIPRVMPSLPDWVIHEPARAVSTLLDRPVSVVNDANLAALGEARRGAARHAGTCVHLLVRRGVGAGIVVNGTPIVGARGMAGEIGHVQIVDDGPYCFCGNRGCLVTQSFDPFKIDALTSGYGHEPTFDDLEDLVEHGDAVALRFFADLGALLAKALASTLVLLDPDILIIDAELRHTATPLIAGLRAQLARSCPPRQAEELTIALGELPDAIAQGALAIANNAVGSAERATARIGPKGP